MKHKLCLLALLALVSQAQAVTTMQLGSGGTLTNLRNSAGTANNLTLVWGLLVDTDNNGFLGSYSPGFAISDTTITPNGQFLSSATGQTSGDRLFISANLMATGGTTDGSAGLAKPTNINLSYIADGAAGVANAGNQSVAIIWFDYTTKNGVGQVAQAGDNYGLYTLPFNTPGDLAGGSLAFGSNFVGVDTVRTANLEFVPEPSAAILGALGALGLLRRRRN